MTEPKVNCLLDFMPVILHRSCVTVVTLREFLLVILAAEFQESYVQGFVNVMQVRVAAERQSVIVALVVNLCHVERSQPYLLHLLVDVW